MSFSNQLFCQVYQVIMYHPVIRETITRFNVDGVLDEEEAALSYLP
jgi:hypothetical protein